jgi:penicillin G amidase
MDTSVATVVNKSQPQRSPAIRKAVRAFAVLVILALVVSGGAGIWFYWKERANLPQLDGSLRLTGLGAPVEVLRDARGVPHIYAKSVEDAAMAQGYVTASDRLWQMELSRRLGRGELSEIVGRVALNVDIETRQLGFRQAAERAVGELDPESAHVVAAYAHGVNAYIASHQDRLPIEFALLGIKPRPWEEADSLLVALNMARILGTSWPEDMMRERLKAKLSPELYADLLPDHSALDHPVAEPSRPGTRSSGRSSRSAGSPLHEATGLPAPPPLLNFGLPEGGPEEFLAGGLEASEGLGSNNWVVSGAHTRSRKPLLANDPHLGHSVPSIWYMAHLVAPGLDVSGVTLPGLPLVVIGHNERIAWGMTNTGPDVADLFIEHFNPANPNQYLHNGRWENADVREEVIHVRGEPDFHLTVKTTRHGPIISSQGNRELALEWTALQPHSLRFTFLNLDRAENWQSFTESLRDFSGPMQNVVYADVDGNIGYYAAGWIPLRNEGDGSVPEPGDSDDYDWTGYVPFEDLPHAFNPPGGLIATANGRVVPDGYRFFITHDWAPPFRTARIFQLLESGHDFEVSDMLRVQMDIAPLDDQWLAKELLAAAEALPPTSADAQYALTLIRAWEGEARADSGATLVLELARQSLLERILKPKLGADVSVYHWGLSTIFLENVLKDRPPRWLPPGDADFNVTLVKSLEAGVARIPALVGSADHVAWKWGDTIPLTFHNRISARLPLLARFLDVGPYPQAGTANTVKATTAAHGPSMRMVVDFSDFDHSVQNLTLGESGNFLSPHYKDQFEAWFHGTSFPMPFSRPAVEQGAVHRLTLEPQ